MTVSSKKVNSFVDRDQSTIRSDSSGSTLVDGEFQELASDVDVFPLSYAQERLWFLDQLRPGQTAYNMPTSIRLRGDLDVMALHSALEGLVRRHETLRTTFHSEGGRAVQRIEAAERADMTLSLVELEGSTEEREQECVRLARQEAAEPFDLSRGPMLRVQLLRLSSEDHVLLLTLHHIVSDGWSLGVLVRELGAFYEAARQGVDAMLPELTVQYADYAVWQQEWMQGEVLEEQLSYWRGQLEGVARLELPTDHRRRAIPTQRGGRVPIALSRHVTDQLRALGQQEGTTLFMLLLAGFQALLARYSGQSDIAVGTALANRTRHEIEGLIGFFVNMLVLRTEVDEEMSFRQLAARVREVTLGAYAHQDLPFERLVEELQPKRDLAHTPLFQVAFLLQNTTPLNLSFSNLRVMSVDDYSETAKFDMTLSLTERGDGSVVGSIEYSKDLFDEKTIERMAGHYSSLMEGMIADPDRAISWIIPAEEETKLLQVWSGSETPYPKDKPIRELFEEQAVRRPDAIAVVSGDEQWSYSELDRRANQIGNYLQRLGVGAETRVGIALERTPRLIASLLGILKAGGAYVPLDPYYSDQRLEFMVNDASIKVVLATGRECERLVSNEKLRLVDLDRIWGEIGLESDTPPQTSLRAESLAYLIYTSGSTGLPKAVGAVQRGVVRLVRETDYVDLGPGRVLLHHSSINFDASTFEIWGSLLNGARLVLMAPGISTPQRLMAALLSYGVDIVFFTTGLFNLLVDTCGEDLTAVENVLVGGEAFSVVHGQRALAAIRRTSPGNKLINGYGPTECTTFACAYVMASGVEVESSVPIGRPIANTRAYVADRHGRLLPEGAIGELYLGGDGLARGYLGRPDLTAEKFVPDGLSGAAGSRLYRTGDLVRYRSDGALEFIGRFDDQVKIRGYRVEPGEIEAMLSSHPGIDQAVVVTRKEAEVSNDPHLFAYVVGRDAMSGEELRKYVQERLPEYMVPRAFIQLPSLPLTANGKVDRSRLPVPESKPQEYEETEDVAEAFIAGAFAEVLKVDVVGRHADFFDLGGHSLLAMRVMSRLCEAYGRELSVSLLFDHPTVQGLAASIGGELQKERGSVLPPRISRAIRGDSLPLSFAQERLWFLYQVERESSFYNVPLVLHLEGRLDIERLERSLREIVRRHEVLRTRFESVNGVPRQLIEAEVELETALADLSGIDSKGKQTELERLIEEEARQPFSLESGRLLRSRLVCLGKEEHVWLFTVHHIVSDGWSLGVMVDEFVKLYGAYSAGLEPPLKPLELQYGDYAVWQREWMSGEELERQLCYWREQLTDLPVLGLPTDFSRPAIQSYRGGSIRVELSAELSAALRELSRREGVTLFMTVLAAFEVLLARYSGQSQVVLGTPVANRARTETEPLIGFFVNTLVLRGDLTDNPTFREFLKRVRRSTLEAYAHQNVPFEEIVRAMQPQRDPSRSPLFQIMFALQNAPREDLELAGLTVRHVEQERFTSKFDLTLELQDREGVISGTVEYNPDLFRAQSTERLVSCFQVLLKEIAANPGQRVEDISVLEAEEEHRILAEWSGGESSYPSDRTVAELFEEQASRRPDAIAVASRDEQWSYAYLDRRSNQMGNYLRSLGVGAESRVGICLERTPRLLSALLGILKAGGAYVPLDSGFSEKRLRHMVKDAAIEVIVTEGDDLGFLEDNKNLCLVHLDRAPWRIEREPHHRPVPAACGTNLMCVIYTSGSTGLPKGVTVVHRGVARLVCETDYVDLRPDRVLLHHSSINFDASTFEIWGSLLNGARLVLMEPGLSTPERLSAALRQYGIDVLFLTTGLFNLFVADYGEGLSDVEQLLTGGDVLTARHAREATAILTKGSLINGYGPTECTTFACAYKMAAGVAVESPVPIGRPIANTRAYVADRHGRLLPEGAIGELYLGGDGLARGYLGRPDLTAEKFVPDGLSGTAGSRLYRSGDLVRYRSDGALEFIGRSDDQVKIRGYRVEPGEIEAVLNSHPGIDQAVVVTQRAEDGAGDLRLIAYVVDPEEANGAQHEELRTYLEERLPEYMVPRTIISLPSLPLNSNGKVDRHALPAPESQSSETEEMEGEEALIAGLFAELLEADVVSRRANFFELGGHSLLAMQVMSRLWEAYGRELSISLLFENPTVQGLAESIRMELRRERGVVIPRLHRANREGPIPLSYAQERVWFLCQMEPDSSFYNVPLALRMEGRLDVGALEQSLREIVRRHEVLRTRFESVNGEPHQVIDPEGRLDVELSDLTGLDDVKKQQELDRLTAHQARQPFALNSGKLFRARLVRLGEEEYVGLFTIHHIISDAWSLKVILNELSSLYEAYAARKPSPLKPLELQYGDYAVWQREWLAGEELERQLGYWREQLADLPVLELPTDYSRPAMQSYRGAMMHLELGRELSAALQVLSRREGVTLFMTMLSALEVLLARYSGQQKVVVGTPIANRSRAETEPIIGFFLNTLVLRGDLTGKPTFRELLNRVRRTTLEAYMHQDLPFEKLVREIQPQRDPSRSPLFQVMLVVVQTPSMPSINSIRVLDIPAKTDTSKFDLTLFAMDHNGELTISIEYASALFTNTSIERMLMNFKRLLENFTVQPDVGVHDVPLLSGEERHKVLEVWNETTATDLMAGDVIELFRRQARIQPDAIAAVYGSQHLTYQNLDEMTDSMAAYLRTLGVSSDRTVGLCMERSLDMLTALIGILKAGGAYVPLDPQHPADRLAFMLQDADACLVITQEQLLPQIPNHFPSLCVEREWPRVASFRDASATRIVPESLAYVIYTSGSTGRPKGIALPHAALTNLIQWHNVNYRRSVRTLQFASMSFDASFHEIFAALCSGGTVFVMEQVLRADTLAVGRYLAENQIEKVILPVVLLQQLAECSIELPSLRCVKEVITTGEQLHITDPIIRFFQQYESSSLHNHYGPSETHVITSFDLTGSPLEWHSHAPVGKPISNTQCYVLDAQLSPVPVGVVGELYLAGIALARGYHLRPDLTSEKFLPNPFSPAPGGRIYRSGDLAKYREDGTIEYLGRIDHQVKIRGFRVELQEIERVLEEHPSVRQAVALVKESARGDKQLAAFLLCEVSDPSIGDIQHHLRSKLPGYMLPASLMHISSLPLTVNGKIDLKALRLLVDETVSDSREIIMPRNSAEHLVCQIWAEVLGVDRVGIRDNFFEIGGHSLLVTRVSSRLTDIFGLSIPPYSLFEDSTVEETVSRLARVSGSISMIEEIADTVFAIQQLSDAEVQQKLAATIN